MKDTVQNRLWKEVEHICSNLPTPARDFEHCKPGKRVVLTKLIHQFLNGTELDVCVSMKYCSGSEKPFICSGFCGGNSQCIIFFLLSYIPQLITLKKRRVRSLLLWRLWDVWFKLFRELWELLRLSLWLQRVLRILKAFFLPFSSQIKNINSSLLKMPIQRMVDLF